LETLFSRDTPFIQTLAKKASELRNDPTTELGSPENLKRLVRLAIYQPVIYCDDSGSMKRRDGPESPDNPTRFEKQCELVQRITGVATKLLPDDMGVHLRFINDPMMPSSLNAEQISSSMRGVTPNHGTKIGTSLTAKILEPLVYQVIDNPTDHLQRPLLICTITDGCPDRESPSFKESILHCKHRLVDAGYDPNAVMFSISQIGEAKEAKAFIDSLAADDDIKDVLFCTTDRLDSQYKELQANEKRMEVWLLEKLTEPLMGGD
jgi:hypothetical protein